MSETEINEEVFSHFASVLQVRDMNASLDFYTRLLGFEMTFSWKEPIEYAVLKRRPVQIHLALSTADILPPDGISIYIFVHDIEAIYQQCRDHNILISAPLEIRDYGMSDFDIKDPDGYQICFGKG